MNQQNRRTSKRLDLQGIRALAIIIVLGFHFYPEYCPNGYLGVDQFFVLSGFLMCMLLKRAENQSPCQLVSLFYSKRFKRILPLYLLVILVSMICLYSFFPDTAIETNQESAIHALLFVSNRPKTVAEDYFTMLSIAVDIFTHTWSLSVEIQFYFLVPFIFLLATKIPEKFQLGYYGVVGFISFVHFYTLPSSVAFNSVFARIWQFLIGMTVYLLGGISETTTQYQILKNEEESEPESKQTLEDEENEEVDCGPNEKFSNILKYSQQMAYFSLMVLICVTMFPTTLSALVVRPVVTIGTGLLMLVSEDNWVLSIKLLTYIGDLSYSLYLIHWPIYAYWKLTCEGNQALLILALISSMIFAVITFETFERWYLKLSSTNIGILVVVLFFLSVVVINRNEITNHIDSIGKNISSLDDVTANMTVDDAERLNYKWSINDYQNLYDPTCVYENSKSPLGWCRHTGLSGKYKIAAIGNSWAANHAKMFYQECGYKAKSIMQGAAFGCEPFYPSGQSKMCKENFTDFEYLYLRNGFENYRCEPLYPSAQSKMCRENFTDFEVHIRKEKPDYAFIVTRYMSIGARWQKNVKSFEKDSMYRIMKKQMLKFVDNIKYKLYILDAIPRVDSAFVYKIARLVKNGTDPVTIDKKLVWLHEYEMARKRNAQLVKDCEGKCELIDYFPEFYNNATKTFRFFDEKGLSYYTSPLHLSPHGIEKIRHIWTDICRKL
ncbi:Protein CBG10743 [Caenorhabditis briggsae]|uniref:Protein CBG10743 n=1 Tax=Caenorhabditis briggsae TaxID=6238 RepID=A8XBP7_CAEBR|nr:Protein CBG10743 [Caenorhabditis briggsae]CAP30063.1 Protein CBG10743 [Caenorhabditis briggsae]